MSMDVYAFMLTLHGVLIIVLAITCIIGARTTRRLAKRIDRLENTFPKKP